MIAPQVVLVLTDSPIDVFAGVAQVLGDRMRMEVGTIQKVVLTTLGTLIECPESSAFRGENLPLLVLLLSPSPVVLDLPPLVVEPVLLSPPPAGLTRRSSTQDLMLRGTGRDMRPTQLADRLVLGWINHQALLVVKGGGRRRTQG